MSEDAHDLTPSQWRPSRPCRPEVEAVVAEVRAALTAQGLAHEAEQDDAENPNCWGFACEDDAGYVNTGLLSWNEEDQRVVFACVKPEVVHHDRLEGVPEDESKCFWRPQLATQFIMALNGEVREIVAEHRAQQLAALAREDDAAA